VAVLTRAARPDPLVRWPTQARWGMFSQRSARDARAPVRPLEPAEPHGR